MAAIFTADGPRRGRERRRAEIGVCTEQLQLVRHKMRAEAQARGHDPDKIATRLVEKLEEAQGIAEIFKVIGEARDDLVGKKSQPRGAAAGIRQVRRDNAEDGELI